MKAGWFMALAAAVGINSIASFGAEPGVEPGLSEYIIGGEEVPASDPISRSTVMISGESEVDGELRAYRCSGSIIAPDMILTAAHCVAENPSDPVPPERIRITFGTKASFPGAVSRAVVGYLAHPAWSGNIQGTDAHDLAVIRIQGAVPPGYAPALLPVRPVPLQPGTSVLLAGYGVTDGVHPEFSTTGILREVSVSVIGPYGKTEVRVDESHRKGSCGGDSGGPAFVRSNGADVLWGVTSRGDFRCSVEGVYTRVDAYLDFLNQAISSLRAKGGALLW